MGWKTIEVEDVIRLECSETPTNDSLDALHDVHQSDIDIIVDLLNADLTTLDIEKLLHIQSEWKEGGKSVVLLVAEDQLENFNSIDEISVAPTEQEALDLIEMERIERALGF